MAPKVELDKLAWQWTESTKPEDITDIHLETAYRLHFKRCKPGLCRRNCRGNPNCLEALGEKEWLGEIDESAWTDCDDPSYERREKGMFAGLKNLGATCYVNSLLQLWFHNTTFREAIYQYKPELESQNDNVQYNNERAQNGETLDYHPKSAIGQLQVIFALLQFSNRRYVDPSDFIKCLGLSTTEQQDAQEFSKLFISLLEAKLQYQTNPKVRNVVQGQFRGEYTYITICSKCKKESTRPSDFYELDLNIKGNKDLYECIVEFLKEEKLEGSDQYLCSTCKSKQNATRKIKLKQLPPVLNLQLLRFIYDRISSQKKKINSNIRFPEVLDMTRFVNGSGDDANLYDLTAVLIHRGISAFSGHYIALIRDRISGGWFKFNDESIEKLSGKHLKLGIEEDAENGAIKTPQRSRLPKGIHSSCNAYMLVYQKRDKVAIAPNDSSVEWDIPEKLQDIIMRDNSTFEEWVMDMDHMREYNLKTNKDRQEEIKSIYCNLMATESDEWEWISTDWLVKWLSEAGPISKIDNTHEPCPHKKFHPDSVLYAKCVKIKTADLLYAKFGGGPRYGKESLCRDCVMTRCRFLRWKAKLQDDSKYITNMCRLKIFSGDVMYWIGKASLRIWKKWALQQVPNNERCTSNDINDGRSASANTPNETEPAEDTSDEGSFKRLNEDIQCVHGGMTLKKSSRRLVQAKVWQLLKEYFPSAIEFPATVDGCDICMEQSTELIPAKDVNRTLAAEQKKYLEELYYDRNRPASFSENKRIQVFLLNEHFMEMWRKFLKEPTRYNPVMELSNATLLCEHKRLIYPPNVEERKISAKNAALVWDKEWEVIRKFFQVDCEVSITFCPLDVKPNVEPSFSLLYNPEICTSCISQKREEQQQQLVAYQDAYIYVSRIPSGTCDSSTLVSTDNSNDVEANLVNGKEENDPEFVQGSTSSKKRKLDSRNPTVTNSNSQSEALFVRRSARNRKCRGDKAFRVSSNQRLKELKCLIMDEFDVATYDQHLILNGKDLVDNQATLAELGLMAGNTIYLKVDQPTEQIIAEKVCVPEEGFKGTELVGS